MRVAQPADTLLCDMTGIDRELLIFIITRNRTVFVATHKYIVSFYQNMKCVNI